ncbi:molybdate transport system ATP-binding protein [Limimonas halophila]|uniref:Molybdate transport system ATP-binding protein n=1 Tax=Limimonas halophila TaxID=1082479 RepID=A0A1G7RVX5_9PROT|nr:molybdenum ABC transporter ATP-binding protein [Limimonas halophila]SDG14963.1 molybdate transport system ATP-binding protein [Limimonas halophila]
MGELTVTVRRAFPDFTLAVDHAFALDGITALFGPSGAGKSTLLRIVAGHERGAQGRVIFDGEAWQDGRTHVPPHRRGVGTVFQDARLFPHLNVRGNLRYADKRAPAGSGRITFDGVVRALDLGPLLDRRPQALSGGERQRVAVGRTLLTRPRLLLMDEPLAALDLRRKADILPHIAALPRTFGVPIVYVTHAIEEVTQLADRMAVLAHGELRAAGETAAVLERRDLQPELGHFEAGVALTARVTAHDADFHLTHVRLGEQRIQMPAAPVPVGSDVRLRVRARDVALAREEPRGISIRNRLRGTVLDVAEEADTAFAEVLVDVEGQHLRARLTRAAVADLDLAPGTPVWALVKSIAFDRRALTAPRPSADDG